MGGYWTQSGILLDTVRGVIGHSLGFYWTQSGIRLFFRLKNGATTSFVAISEFGLIPHYHAGVVKPCSLYVFTHIRRICISI